MLATDQSDASSPRTILTSHSLTFLSGFFFACFVSVSLCKGQKSAMGIFFNWALLFFYFLEALNGLELVM